MLKKIVESPEDHGKYYEWNIATAWAATGPFTGCSSTYPPVTEWETGNNPYSNTFRVPTKEQLESLMDLDKVTGNVITQNGIDGKKFTDIATNNTIFIMPFAGHIDETDNYTLVNAGLFVYYWSRTSDNIAFAYAFGFDGDNFIVIGVFEGCRYVGAVCEGI